MLKFVPCFIIFVAVTKSAPSLQNDVSTRISQGNRAFPGQFPFQSGIITDPLNPETKSFCGGALISDRWVVTAGHCVLPQYFRVILGTINWNITDTDSYYSLSTTDYLLHDGYDDETLKNNIGLIKAATWSISFTPERLPIRLSAFTLAQYMDVTVSGWGRTSRFDNSDVVLDLNFAALITIPNEDCQRFYPNFEITEEMVCATSRGDQPIQSICAGDIGDPLVTNLYSDPELVGIASHFNVDDECNAERPSVFTRIAPFKQWIEDNMHA